MSKKVSTDKTTWHVLNDGKETDAPPMIKHTAIFSLQKNQTPLVEYHSMLMNR